MALFMKQNETFYPLNIGLLCSIRIMLGSKRIANLVKEFFGLFFHLGLSKKESCYNFLI